MTIAFDSIVMMYSFFEVICNFDKESNWKLFKQDFCEKNKAEIKKYWKIFNFEKFAGGRDPFLPSQNSNRIIRTLPYHIRRYFPSLSTIQHLFSNKYNFTMSSFHNEPDSTNDFVNSILQSNGNDRNDLDIKFDSPTPTAAQSHTNLLQMEQKLDVIQQLLTSTVMSMRQLSAQIYS